MRDTESNIPRMLFTFVAIAFVGLTWGAMTSGMLRSSEPARGAGHEQVYRAVLVTGMIRPARTNRDGVVRAVELVVPRVGSFRISDSGKGRDLREHVGQTVTIVAMSRLDAEGHPILEVGEYSIHAS